MPPENREGGRFSTADLAVVIPSHSQVASLETCLKSLRESGGNPARIIVVDDGSVDAAVSRCAGAFAGVCVLRNEQPIGFARAANLGMKCADSPVIQLLNDDARVTEGWADKALVAFRDPRVGAVAPLVMVDGGSSGELDSAGDRFTLAGIVGKRGHGRPSRGTESRTGRWVLGASASSAFYRRAALEQVGFLDESFGAYFEDVDLSLRLNRAGWRVWHEPSSLVYHRVSSSYGRSPKPEVLRMQSRNEERLFWRHLPPPWLFAGAPLHLAALCAKALKNWRKGTLAPFLQGKGDAWREVLGSKAPRLPRTARHANPWQWNLDLW